LQLLEAAGNSGRGLRSALITMTHRTRQPRVRCGWFGRAGRLRLCQVARIFDLAQAILANGGAARNDV
jgi:hypothetical protein